MSSRASSSRGKKANEKTCGDRLKDSGNSSIKAENQLYQRRTSAAVQRSGKHGSSNQPNDCPEDSEREGRADSSRGFQVGDRVSYKSSNGYARTGVIAQITETGAYLDEGHPYKSWIEFKYLELCSDSLSNSTCVVGWALDSPLPESKPEDLNSSDLPILTAIAAISSQNDSQKSKTTKTCDRFPYMRATTSTSPEELTSSQHRHPASPSPSRESEREEMTQETVSRQSLKRSRTSNQNSLRSKTSLDLSLALKDLENQQAHISETCFIPLTASGTMRNGFVSVADTLPPLGNENGCCWLESPGALSSSGNGRPPGQSKLEVSLKQKGLLEKQQSTLR